MNYRWGSHPYSLLIIFNSIIKAKVDFGSFLFTSIFSCHRNKLNSHLFLCLRPIRSTPLSNFQVECVYSPLDLGSRRLAGSSFIKICPLLVLQYLQYLWIFRTTGDTSIKHYLFSHLSSLLFHPFYPRFTNLLRPYKCLILLFLLFLQSFFNSLGRPSKELVLILTLRQLSLLWVHYI